ncbi:MAG: hypothetical protein IPM42_04910 [Saprospiraceae bacterium]|nr:hypothetical protein [Saprospiraceae bacterium]
MFLRFVLYCSFIFSFSSEAFSQSDWKKFSPDGHKFSLMAPGEMKYGEKNIITDVGPLKLITYLHQSKKDDPNHLYIINYVDYPEGTFHPDSTEVLNEFFDITISQNVKDLGGELVYKTEISSGTTPGQLYRVNYNKNSASLKSKIFLYGDRFYSLQVYSSMDKSLNADIDHFLNSLSFEKPDK